MSDHIEHDGKRYFEEGYLQMANNTAKRRQAIITGLEERLKASLDVLHKMVEQYCSTGKQTDSGSLIYDDMCMSAPEEACQVLQNEGRITGEQWD